jgi:hypothetical protein
MPGQVAWLWLGEGVPGEPLSPLQVDNEVAQFPHSDFCNLSRETICAKEFLKVAYRSLDYGDCSGAFSFTLGTQPVALHQMRKISSSSPL